MSFRWVEQLIALGSQHGQMLHVSPSQSSAAKRSSEHAGIFQQALLGFKDKRKDARCLGGCGRGARMLQRALSVQIGRGHSCEEKQMSVIRGCSSNGSVTPECGSLLRPLLNVEASVDEHDSS